MVNKAAGMVVHPAYGNWTGTLVNGLMHHVEELGGREDDPGDLRQVLCTGSIRIPRVCL